MKRKVLSTLIAVIFLLFCFFVSPVLPLAATTNTDITWNAVLSGGVNDMDYWISPDCTFTATIPAAVEAWVCPGWTNPINLTAQASNYGSEMDFYEYSSKDYRNGYSSTYLWGPVQVTLAQKDTVGFEYDFGRIYINAYYMDTYTSNRKMVITAHEMGHVFGLKDISSTSSLMYYATPISVTGVTYDANQAIVSKYP